jgi:signal transduction histidine kinase
VATHEVPAAVCEAVTSALRLPAAELVLPSGRTAAQVGGPADAVAEVPLTYRAEQVGLLRVGLRRGERTMDPRDRALLGALADTAAPAVASLRLYDALRTSREALVASREEERRRLRRDLHDGVGAALAGARLQLESARHRVDEPVTAGLLDAAGRAVAEAVADVRRLTDDLRPPALDELGLAGSLRALGTRTSTPDRQVAVDVDAPAGLSAAVEVALHRIASEALTNAARHSGAGRVDLRLRATSHELVLEVADDGRGLSAADGRGVGLDSMRQRAEELGGRLDVDAAPDGGTRVRAVLPREVVVPEQRPGAAQAASR